MRLGRLPVPSHDPKSGLFASVDGSRPPVSLVEKDRPEAGENQNYSFFKYSSNAFCSAASPTFTVS
jgi:hypothetical protein